MKKTSVAAAFLVLCLSPLTALAQSSIGFQDPNDLGALLDYRLPDWGYRTMGFRLNPAGFGRGEYGPAVPYDRHDAGTSLDQTLSFRWYRESEDRTSVVQVSQAGRWTWSRSTQDSLKTYRSSFDQRISLTGTVRRYVAGNTFLLGEATVTPRYQESRRRPDPSSELSLSRQFDGTVRVGIGAGRLRNVTPILQARRLGERLRALGRKPLDEADVLKLADVLARRNGYESIFDRPDPRLWGDVLEPLLTRGDSFSPYEVLYLRDVFQERLGTRFEGGTVDLSAVAIRNSRGGDFRGEGTQWGPLLDAQWTHNLNLDRQVTLSLTAEYLRGNSTAPPWDDRNEAVASLSTEYLWILADRVSWSTGLYGSLSYTDPEAPAADRRVWSLRVQSDFRIYVEDRMTFEPMVNAEWYRTNTSELGNRDQFFWNLGVGLTYDLENTLF